MERKEQWVKEKEEKRRTAPDPTVPAGHTLLSESERQETLKSLKHSMYHPSDTLYVQPYYTNSVLLFFLICLSPSLLGYRAAVAPHESGQSEHSLTPSSP